MSLPRIDLIICSKPSIEMDYTTSNGSEQSYEYTTGEDFTISDTFSESEVREQRPRTQRPEPRFYIHSNPVTVYSSIKKI